MAGPGRACADKSYIMGSRGRFGKYGEKKRIDRLREARTGRISILRKGGSSANEAPHRAKKTPPKAEITIRPAEVSDAEFIRTLSWKAFQQYGPYEEILPTWFLSGIGVTFLAFMGKRAVGYAMLGRGQGESASPRVAELLAIAVEPSARNHGVGDRLMGEIIRKAKELLVERLVLHTAVDNLPSQGLFGKHGFILSGIMKGFYPKHQSALMMHRDTKRDTK